MSVTIHFKGGPLGGEIREVEEHPGPTYLVPSLMHRSVLRHYGENDTIPPPTTMYRTEEYRLYRPLSTRNEFEYRWVHPAEGLERQVAELKAQKAELLERPTRSALVDELDELIRATEESVFTKGLKLARAVIAQ